MKQLSFSVLLLAVILATSSCKKVVQSNWSNSKVSFKIDGVTKEAKGDQNVLSFHIKEQSMVQIIGNIGGSGTQQIGLTIADFHGVGEYTAEEGEFLGSYSSPELGETVIGIEGTIKITEFKESKSLKGEFQFKGQALIVTPDPDINPGEIRIFTEGKFEAKISAYSGPIIEPG
jgi:hypothetical protein